MVYLSIGSKIVIMKINNNMFGYQDIMLFVIICIISLIVLPKIPDDGIKSRKTSIVRLQQIVEKAATLASKISSKQKCGRMPVILPDGTTVKMINGYPSVTFGGIDVAVKEKYYKGFTYNGDGLFSMDDAPDSAKCSVTYDVSGITPLVIPNVSGC